MNSRTAHAPAATNGAREPLPKAPHAWARSVQFFAEAFLEIFGLIWLTFAFALVPIGVGVWLLPGALDFAQANAQRSRALARRLTGVAVDAVYAPVTGPAGAGQARHTWQRLADRVVWRDIIWHMVNPIIGLILGILSLALVLDGVWELAAIPFELAFAPFRPATWFTIVDALGLPVWGCIAAAVFLAAIQITVGVLLARPLLRLQGAWTRLVLNVEDTAMLRHRADVLARSRADALDLEQAEIQRIERDLHDGAQMRFISTGLTIAEAARLVHDEPERAVELLGQARHESAAGLAELRNLVRGIRPPVLADRGLVEALRALARDSAIPATVTSTVQERLAAPLESALYFAVAEALNNAVKHAAATGVAIDISQAGGVVTITVTDDGCGGAVEDAEQGGLFGIRRRLSTFDATLAVDSPRGGPTVLTIVAPLVVVPIRPESTHGA